MKRKTLILTTLLCLAPIALGVALYDQLPEVVPTHFAMDGTPDGWSSRATAVFGLPVFMAALNGICFWASGRMEKRQERKVAPDKLMALTQWIPAVISLIMVPTTLLSAAGREVPLTMILSLFLGLTFLIVGNYLPKCKMNPYIGIKLPWTYSSEENWNKTHRLGGFVWVAAGVVMLLSAILGSNLLMGTAIGAGLLIPAVYSYLLYRKDKAREKEGEG